MDEKKEVKFDIYEILKNITYKKDADIVDHPLFNKVYNQFSINEFLSSVPQTTHLAAFACDAKMTNREHYLFLMYTTEKEFIYFKREYAKKETNGVKERIKCISDYYQLNMIRSQEVYNLLSESQIEDIFNIYNKKIDKKVGAYERI